MSTKTTGVVKFFNDEKRFGFIAQDHSSSEFFVHANNLSEPIQKNDKVEFETREGRKGPEAFNVKRLDN